MTEISLEQWQQLLDKATEVGTQHGKNAAEWWIQEAFTKAAGPAKGYAGVVLVKLDECDTDDLGLPDDGMSGEMADSYVPRDLYRDLGVTDEDDSDDMKLVDTYQAAFYTAVEGAVRQAATDVLES